MALPFPQKVRDLILRALPQDIPALYRAEDLQPRYVYFPPSHTKALRPDTMVVVGMRGAGKSFWWAALQNQKVRNLIAQVDRYARIEASTEVYVGFGPQPAIERYPDRDVLSHLLEAGREARLIWRTLVASNLLPGRIPGSWKEKVEWVEQHPEEIARWLEEKDWELAGKGTYALILFDALDQAAYDWREMYTLIRGLLQVALELRSTRRIRLKVFLRPDQMEESRVATFPDASKVVSSRIPLTWLRLDLYGLLWQYLANTEGAETFRRWEVEDKGFSVKIKWESLQVDGETIWRWPGVLREEENLYRRLFHQIAGEWMGRDPKRGFPYSWLPGHLADAHGQTSPRSFLAAIRAAAEDTQRRYPDHEYPLHYESIKRGVQWASEIRVGELKEDYPWVDTLMQPLRGLLVPCEFENIQERWEQEGVLQKLQEQPPGEAKLLPSHLGEGYPGLRKDLESLGIFLSLEDGRVNIPDVFRVGYGLGRRGGVKPLSGAG